MTLIITSNNTYNKASQSDLRKLSSFLQKTRKKAANSLRQLLAALNAMRQKLYLYIRFFIYGLISFVIFGVFLEAPAIGVREISYKLVVYLGLAGGFSMMFSCISAHILFGFIKDLIYGNN
jgi:hypothetical protein